MRRTQAQRSETTRAALMGAARALFAEHGYAGTAAEEVVRRAGVTRGAMYHHFGDKRGLFRAVHEQLEQELVAAIGARVAGMTDPFALLTAGLDVFLDACLRPDLAQIALRDAPSVLGWAEWRAIDMRYSMGLVAGALQLAIDQGRMRPQPVVPLAHLVISAAGEAGLLIAGSDDPAAARDEVRGPLVALLEGLRA